ncbi:hypothetical protein J3Q64DRAFT_1728787 [Phycomyces blakesleeanus]|uniref:Uncharacterized protein n=1 Tax=Phycomyces blakesleeanus TaxID=4837 RepID=A0ABR3B7E0_PHYBL
MSTESRLSSWILKNNKDLLSSKSTRQSLLITQCHYAANSTKSSNILVLLLTDGQYWIPALMDTKKIKEVLEISQALENHLAKLVGMVINISKTMFAVYRRGDALSPHLIVQEYELAELKQSGQQTTPKEIHEHPDIKLWLDELQTAMPDLEQESINELYPSKDRKEIDGFLNQYESVVSGFEYLMLHYYNEIIKTNLKRSNNIDHVKEWRQRMKTNAKKRKVSTWNIIDSGRDLWKDKIVDMMSLIYLDYKSDVSSEKDLIFDSYPTEHQEAKDDNEEEVSGQIKIENESQTAIDHKSHDSNTKKSTEDQDTQFSFDSIKNNTNNTNNNNATTSSWSKVGQNSSSSSIDSTEFLSPVELPGLNTDHDISTNSILGQTEGVGSYDFENV